MLYDLSVRELAKLYNNCNDNPVKKYIIKTIILHKIEAKKKNRIELADTIVNNFSKQNYTNTCDNQTKIMIRNDSPMHQYQQQHQQHQQQQQQQQHQQQQHQQESITQNETVNPYYKYKRDIEKDHINNNLMDRMNIEKDIKNIPKHKIPHKVNPNFNLNSNSDYNPNELELQRWQDNLNLNPNFNPNLCIKKTDSFFTQKIGIEPPGNNEWNNTLPSSGLIDEMLDTYYPNNNNFSSRKFISS